MLLVDKPAGDTSHDVVVAARRALGVRRIGHTGTLDPFATGLLLLLLGRVTRLAEYFHELPKRYEATLRLGVETDTDDLTGRPVSASEGWRALESDAVEAALAGWVGERAQVPSVYSAKQVGGRRAYDVARRGGEVELAAAPITIHALEALEMNLPDVRVRAVVSTGTYIRALARDVGRDLGCGAHLTALRRTSIGPFEVADAAVPGDWDASPGAWRTPAEAVSWMPRRRVGGAERSHLRHGRAIPIGELESVATGGGEGEGPVAILSDGDLVAIGRMADGELRPAKVFDA